MSSISIPQFEVELQFIKDHVIVPESIEALDTLHVYITNLLQSPKEVKFHTISAINIHFYERLGHLPFCDSILSTIGYDKYSDPVLHYRFNYLLLTDENINPTLELLRTILHSLETLRTSLTTIFQQLPHPIPNETSYKSVYAAGIFADRGRRPTMEDQEALIDQFYSSISTDFATAFSEFILQSPQYLTSDAQKTLLNNIDQLPSSRATPSPQLVNELQNLLPQYTNLGFYAVYDGHGGTETADFVVKVLHHAIQFELRQALNVALAIHIPEVPSIRQQQQYNHTTNQFLKKLPDVHQIQYQSTEDVLSTDFSGRPAFQYFESLLESFLQSYFSQKLAPNNDSKDTTKFISSFLATYNKAQDRQSPSPTSNSFVPAIPTFTPPSTDSTSFLTHLSNQQSPTTSSFAFDFASKIFALSPSRLFPYALSQAHVRTDNQLRRCLALHSGCTTVTSVVGSFLGQRFVVTANVGDSRAILGLQTKECCIFNKTDKKDKKHIVLQHAPMPAIYNPNADTSKRPQHQFHTNSVAQDISHFSSLNLPIERATTISTTAVSFGDFFVLKPNRINVQRLSVDHKPLSPNETKRITELDGFVSPVGRTQGVLAVSRALGDHGLKSTKHFVSAKPHIDMQLLADPMDVATYQHPFLILACDGVWDVLSDETAMTLISGLTAALVNLWLGHYSIKMHQIDADQVGKYMDQDIPESSQSTQQRNLYDLSTSKPITIQDMTKLVHDTSGDAIHDNQFKNQICFTCLQHYLPRPILNQMMSFVSKRLVECALANGSTDNVTAMVIRL